MTKCEVKQNFFFIYFTTSTNGTNIRCHYRTDPVLDKQCTIFSILPHVPQHNVSKQTFKRDKQYLLAS